MAGSLTLAMPCTITLSSPFPQQVEVIANSTNAFYIGHSSTSTPQAPSVASGGWFGGQRLTITEKTGIQSVSFVQADTSNSMTAYLVPTTIGQAP